MLRSAGNLYNIISVTSSVLNTYQMNPTAWGELLYLIILVRAGPGRIGADADRLEGKGRFLLGRILIHDPHLGLLPTSRVQGPEFPRARYLV